MSTKVHYCCHLRHSIMQQIEVSLVLSTSSKTHYRCRHRPLKMNCLLQLL